MNKARRKQILNAKSELLVIEDLRSILESVRDDLDSIKDDEDNARENIPESLQETDRYYASEEASDHLDSAMDELDAAIENIENAISELDEIELFISCITVPQAVRHRFSVGEIYNASLTVDELGQSQSLVCTAPRDIM